MPTAVAMMPPSLIGESKQRVAPYFFCNPSVTRNTPPKYPASSPNVSTLGSRESITSRAEFSAWIMFIVGIASLPHNRHGGADPPPQSGGSTAEGGEGGGS